MNKFNKAPLPFQGQKRNFIKQFNELIKDEFSWYKEGIFIDAFGGSGLLSHNIKQIYPNARVIYNDFDNYCERLVHIPQTNEILAALMPYLSKYKKGDKISAQDKTSILEILKDYETKEYFMDCLTLSSAVLFSGSYAHDMNELKKHKTWYKKSDSTAWYEAKEYLAGVEIVRKNAFDLLDEFKDTNAVLVLDPPYLQTNKEGYKCFWGLREFLKLMRLIKEPFIFFSNENSDILPYIDDRIECGDNVFKDYKIKQASLSNGAKTKPDYMIYKSGIRSLF